MRSWTLCCILPLITIFVSLMPVSGADIVKKDGDNKAIVKSEQFSLNRDMAFISIMGSRPDAKALKGFQRAVLFNAQGAKLLEITFNKNDSIYSLDKMLQKNKDKGPLLIRMYH